MKNEKPRRRRIVRRPANCSPAGEIYKLLSLVMADIGAIAKSKKNEAQGYIFRGIDDVLNALHPALVAHGVSSSVQVVWHREQLIVTESPGKLPLAEARKFNSKLRWVAHAQIKLRVRLSAPDGSYVTFEGVGSAVDHNGDKATNKAHSYAYKYAVALGLCIPVQAKDLDDGDYDAKVPEPDQEPGYRHRRGAGRAAANGAHTQQARSGEARAPARRPQDSGNPPPFSQAAAAARAMAVKRAEIAIGEAETVERCEDIRRELHNPRRALEAGDIARLEAAIDRKLAALRGTRQDSDGKSGDQNGSGPGA